MTHAVLIPTAGRRSLVERTIAHLAHQTRRPNAVIVSVADESDAPRLGSLPFPVEIVVGPRGSTTQRNSALEQALPRFEIITFLDDDFIPACDYLELVADALRSRPDWVVIRGEFEDGARAGGFSFEQGLLRLEHLMAQRMPGPPRVVEHVGAHGSNFSLRAADVGSLRFDERLRLYGWQEDIDFTAQLGRRGLIVSLDTLLGVHLAVRNTRSNGMPFGYTQIVNPIYLVRKGTMPARFAARLMARNLAANVFGSLKPEPHVDRRGRLKGNLLAAYHVLTGRIEPEHVTRLTQGRIRSQT